MAVTLQDIANRVGLSKPTVTRILGKDAHLFSPSTRERVLRMAAELGYRPNAAARAIGRGRFNCLTLILGSNDVTSDLPAQLVYGIQDEMNRHDLHLAIARLPDEQLTDEGMVPKVLREWMCDGMLINYTHNFPPRMLELIRVQNTPAIWLNTKLDADCVYMDDFAASRELTASLLRLGHRRIAYARLSETPEFSAQVHYSVTDRSGGYISAMEAAGLASQVLVDGHVPATEHVAAARQLLTAPDRPTAIITYNESTAATFIAAALLLDLKVPHDLSIATFPLASAHALGLELTGRRVPVREEGQVAVINARRKIESPATRLKPTSIEFVPVEGVTTAPPPRPRAPRNQPPAAVARRNTTPDPSNSQP